MLTLNDGNGFDFMDSCFLFWIFYCYFYLARGNLEKVELESDVLDDGEYFWEGDSAARR